MLPIKLNKMFLGLFLVLVAMFVMPLFAMQDATATETLDPTTIYTSIGGLAGAVLFVTAWLKKILVTQDTVTIVLSGVISLLLSTAGYFLNLGIFNAVEWYYIFIYGVIAMLVANGLSTWEFIKSLLVLIKLRVPAETE